MTKKYREVLIRKAHSGFGMYETYDDLTEAGTRCYESVKEILDNCYDEFAEVYELGKDKLPEGVKDIRGNIYNEPTYVFAGVYAKKDERIKYFPGEQVIYFGVEEEETLSPMKKVYWVLEEGGIVKGEILLASTELDGNLSDEELLKRAKEEALSSGMSLKDFNSGRLYIDKTSEEEEEEE